MVAARQSWFRKYRASLLSVVVVVALFYAQFASWPYVIYSEGSAEPLHHRVETGSEVAQKGAFLFTTVSQRSEPSAIRLLFARIDPREDIRPEEEATGGIANWDAYRNYVAWLRDSSEDYALLAAYGAMGRTIDAERRGVIIVRLLPESQAGKAGLQEGDIVERIDDADTATAEEMTAYLSGKQPGDIVKLSGTRGGKPFEVSVPLVQMPESTNAGIGSLIQSVLEVTPPDPVKFDFDDIGGPSAGLMMTLEIVSQLTKEDLTRGYRVAGTGTIAADGKVGLIGGIRYKLMAAERERADYFLVPAGNWEEAEAATAKLGIDKPELVKIDTLDQALSFLRQLSEKGASVAAQ